MGHSCPANRDVLFVVRRRRAWHTHTHTTFILIKTTAFLRRTVRQNQYPNNYIESGPRSIHTWYSKSSNFDQNCIWSKHVNLQYQISPSPYIENTLGKHKMKTYKHRTHATYLRLTLNPLTWKIWWAPNNASRWQTGFNSAFKGLNHSLHPQGLLRKFQAVVIYIIYRVIEKRWTGFETTIT